MVEWVWRMDGGAGLGLWLQAGLVHEVDPWWGTGVGAAAWGRLSLAHISGSHLRVKGQTLLGPDHFPSTPSTASAHLLCFQAECSSSRSKQERDGSVCPKAASEMNCLWEVPRLPFHSLSP